MSIDPLAFEKYRITQVPAVVVVGNAGTCVDTLTGDIPLFAALTYLRDHGECSLPEIPLLLEHLEKGGIHA